MSNKIEIKIVEVDTNTRSLIVKYRAENNKLAIDEYPPVAFQISHYKANTVEEFIESITPQISLYAYMRELEENPNNDVDISGWAGFTTKVDPVTFPTIQDPAVTALADPEVSI